MSFTPQKIEVRLPLVHFGGLETDSSILSSIFPGFKPETAAIVPLLASFPAARP
jgi:hypothetical protein